MNWVTAAFAISKIQKGKRIFISSGCAEPQYLVKELSKNASNFSDNEIVHLLTLGEAPYVEPEYQGHFRHNAFFIGPNVREAVSKGNADYTPIFLSEIPNLFETGQMPIHCAIIQTSLPDSEGYVSLGISVDIILSAIKNADIVIAQVNKHMPHTCGEARIPTGQIDYFVKHDEELLELPRKKLDDVSLKIGKHVSQLIGDGDTLQLGIGVIPDAVLSYLKDKNDLGIHSEMFSDGVIDLYKNKNITNKYKGLHNGASVTSFVMGSKALYEVVDNNKDFLFYPSDYVNDPSVIAQNKNMVSINSALEIDLTGQICADSIGSTFFSGIGGQVDFVRGARRSEGGRSIIAFPSTAKKGTLSRIKPLLTEGAGVVTSRGDVQYVATEYGIAYLHGKSIRERGLALIQIAHPKFRDELLNSLKERHYVYLDQKTIKKDDSIYREKIPRCHDFKGKRVYFRALSATDEKSIQDFFYSHDPKTIYQRYNHLRTALPHHEAQRRVTVDYAYDMAIAGFDSTQPYAEMICLVRYMRDEKNRAEMAFVVGEDYQGHGIGGFLCDLLIKIAKDHNITELYASVLNSNSPMAHIFKKRGFKLSKAKDGSSHFFELSIQKEKSA